MNYELKHFDTTLVRFSATEDTNTPEIKILWMNKTKKDLNITLKFLSIVSIGIVIMGSLEIITGFHIQPKTSYIMANLDFNRLEFLRRVPTVFFYS